MSSVEATRRCCCEQFIFGDKSPACLSCLELTLAMYLFTHSQLTDSNAPKSVLQKYLKKIADTREWCKEQGGTPW